MKYAVCTLDQLQEGKPFITTLNNIEIGIYLSCDRVFAVRNVCPHKLAPVCKGVVAGTMLPSEPCEYDYGLEGQVIKCPWHGWEFSIFTGEAMFGVSNRKIKTYSTSVKDNRVYVELR